MACCGGARGGGGFWGSRSAGMRAANPVRMAATRAVRITNAARPSARFTNALRAMRLWPQRAR